MTEQEWWAPQIQTELSQGDIIRGLPLFSVACPPTYLSKTTMKGGKDAWVPVDKPSSPPFNALAAGKEMWAIVLSHSCELDKTTVNSPKVLLAPMLPISAIGGTADYRQLVVQQGVRNLMPVPGIAALGEIGVADLRSMMSIPRGFVDQAVRVASMTDLALQRLAAQLVGYFLRLELPETLTEKIAVQLSE